MSFGDFLSAFDSGDNIQSNTMAANSANKGLKKGYKLAGKHIGAGKEEAYGFLDEGAEPYKAMLDPKGVNMYGQLAGLNGLDAANSAYDANPYGYAEKLGQEGALDRMERHFAGTGQTGQMALDLSRGLADRRAGAVTNALNSFRPYFDREQAGAQGFSNAMTNKAGVATDASRAMADYGWQMKTGVGNNNANMHLANQGAVDMAGSNWAGLINGGLNFGTKLLGMV